MTDAKDIRIAELEQALLPFLKVGLARMSSYDQRADLVIWRPPVTSRSKAVVTCGDIIRAKALLGVSLDS